MPNIIQLTDLRTPWCVHTVATLGIAEHVAEGTERIEDLARAVNCDAHVLGSVMAHLVDVGVFEQREPGRFSLNGTARELLDPAVRIGLDLDGIGGRMAHAWSTIPRYVKTGAPAYSDIFGLPFWEDLQAHPEVQASFDELMGPAGHGTPDPDIPLRGGWESVKTVVDVGGGTGAMLVEILKARPWIEGTLVDLPGTVAKAPAMDRLRTVGQSFFDPLPPGADVYLVRKVINDWPDAEAKAILLRCAEAARPTGRVLVLRSIGPDSAAPEPVTIECVLLGGKHRGLSAFRELARESGLEVMAAERDCVECSPVS